MGRKPTHEDILGILPWFVNESLGDRETQQVLVHLQDCEACRAERDRLQALQQMLIEDDEAGQAQQSGDYQQAFQQLMTRIAVAEANRMSTREARASKRGFGWAPYVAVAASLVAVLVFVATLNPPPPSGEAQYRTLSNTTSQPGTLHRVALTFEQPIKAETLRAALIETHSNIVSGPDSNGTYIVEIRVPENMSDARFIQSIRNIDGVKYASFDTAAGGR